MTNTGNHWKAEMAKPDAERVWAEFTAALDALPPDVRAAFLLHEIFEASYDDIARLIGQPADTCRLHVEYAREHALAHVKRGEKDQSSQQ